MAKLVNERLVSRGKMIVLFCNLGLRHNLGFEVIKGRVCRSRLRRLETHVRQSSCQPRDTTADSPQFSGVLERSLGIILGTSLAARI